MNRLTRDNFAAMQGGKSDKEVSVPLFMTSASRGKESQVRFHRGDMFEIMGPRSQSPSLHPNTDDYRI